MLNDNRWLVASQMEYVEARKSFISFDEPGFKSVFRITLIHDNNTTAMSNTQIKSSQE
jgi:aminopeptidase N